MTFRQGFTTAVLLLGLTDAAAAQSVVALSTPAAPAPAAAPEIDVSRLPIDLRRIEKSFRQTTIREQRDGLNLRYFVDVYAKAPAIVLFTPEDNLVFGPAPYGGPTHREMLEMMTPREFRASGMMLGSGIRVPRKKSDSR